MEENYTDDQQEYLQKQVLSLEDVIEGDQRDEQSLILSPKILLIRVWETIISVSSVLCILAVTLLAAFDANTIYNIGIVYACDFIHILGMISHFFIGYEEKGIIVTDFKRVALHYIKTTFFLDLVSAIPFEAVAPGTSSSDYFAAILRLNRLIRCYQLWRLLSNRENELGSNTSILRGIKFVYLAALSIHLQACVWFALACHNNAYKRSTVCRQGSWANSPQAIALDINLAVSSIFKQYIMALYWAVATATSTGYGDIHPLLEGEKWFSIVCMLWGIVMFGYILGGLASMLTNQDTLRARYVHRVDIIKDHLKEANISEDLTNKVIGYYEYLWMRNKGKESSEAFEELPLAFQAELSLETYKELILKSNLFEGAPQGFIRMLSTMVKHMLYLPKQVIVNKGEIEHNMYFIYKGIAEVIDDDDPVAEFKEGDIFGEINLVYNISSQAMVRAKTHCDVLLLNKRDLHNALQHFPDVNQQMRLVIQKRCNLTPGQDGLSVLSLLLGNHDRGENKEQRRASKHSRKGSHSLPETLSPLNRFIKLWNDTPIIPGSRFAIAWDSLLITTILASCWLYSFQAGFSHFNPSLGYSDVSLASFRFLLTYLFDLVFVIDIIISLKRSFHVASGYETEAKVIALSYICSMGFVLDIVAVIPFELGAFGIPNHVLDWAITFKINRLIKLWKIVALFNRLENSLNYSIGKIRAVKFLLSIVILTHLTSCVWFPLACNSEGKCNAISWASEHSVTTNSSALHDYVVSLYWAAATMTSTGYGDVSAVSSGERIVAIIVMVIGLILYGYILGSVAATIANTLLPRVNFQEKMQVVHQFMSDNMLGHGLLYRVDDFYTLLWMQSQGEALPGEDRLLHRLPQSLQQDVSMEECSDILSSIPFFAHTDVCFLRQLSHATVTYMFSPGDVVVYHGDMGREMYCVRRGYLEVLSEDLSQIVTIVPPGGYFGELGFLFGAPRTSTVRAATHCELITLSYYDMIVILESYPLLYKQFQEIALNKEHFKLARQACNESSRQAMLRPHQFSKPCILTALANAMGPSLAVITRIPLTAAVMSTVGDKDAQSKVSCPSSLNRPVKETLVRYNRKQDLSTLNRVTQTMDEEGVTQSVIRQRRQSLKSSHVETSTKDIETIDVSPMYTFIPQSKYGVIWEWVAVFLAVVSAITIPLQAGFLHSFMSHCIPLWVINYTLDIFFIADLLLKVHTAYYTSDGILVTRPLSCAKHYLKTNFIIDCIGLFPTDVVLFVVWPYSMNEISRMLALVRLNRIVRVYKLPLTFDYLESQITRSTGLIQEIKFLVYMLIVTHITACIWFLLACASLSMGSDVHTCDVGSWALKEPFVKPLSNFSLGYQYIVSIYWASATMSSVGYGDIHAHTDVERIYALSVMIIGIVSYGYIIASVAAGLANADSGRARYQEKLKAVKSYLKDQSIDAAIQRRVVNYYEYIWQRTKGRSFSSLFNGMPRALQADISLSLYKKIIDQVPLFQNTEIGFTKLLALSIKPVLYLSKEYIVKKGDIGSEMFFINRGTVEVVSEDGEVVFAVMNEGKFFGEISLIFSCPRTASIRAATNCDLFVLTKTDLDAALTYYPHIAEQIKEVAGNRANLVKKRSQAAAKAAAEGKSASDAAKAAAQVTKEDDKDDSNKTKDQAVFVRPDPRTDSDDDHDGDHDNEEHPSGCQEFINYMKRETKETIWPAMKPALTFTISPVGKFGTIYSYVGCLLAYFSAFTISYQAFFQNNSPGLWTVNYMFECYFIFEIFIKFHLGYEDVKGRIVSDFKSVALHYLKTPSGFSLDIIAALPYEIIALPIPTQSTRQAVLLYIRIFHVIRVIRIRDFFSVEEKRLNQKTVLIRLLKFIVLISLSAQFVACIWYVLGCQAGTCKSGTWAEGAGLTAYATSSLHYCNSLYWAVATMTTTGYGDYSATNVQEMIFATAIMIYGKLLFGFILGSIASTLANLETQRVMFEEKLNAIKDYMREQHLSSTLQNRVLKYFDYLWIRNKGVDRQSLFKDIPSCMQAEVSLATTEELIKSVPIFASVNAAFLRHLTLMIKPCIFLPNEYIVHKGDIGHGIYFIYHGKLEVVDEDAQGSPPKAILNEGQYFGEKNLIYNLPREWSIRAKTHCDIFTLTPEDFNLVLQSHPNVETYIAQVANDLYGIPLKR